jgi:hypothetical protein
MSALTKKTKAVNQALEATPVILTTQEADIRRIAVRSQRKWFTNPYSQKTLSKTKWAGGVAQGEDPQFKPQYAPCHS